MEKKVAHERRTYFLPAFRKKLAVWKSGKVNEMSGKMIVKKKMATL